MLPAAMLAGISYSDFWKMTIGELHTVLKAQYEYMQSKANADMQTSAFIAYYSGAFSRNNVKLPQSLSKAFPKIFGKTASGNIKADNWQESERALVAIAANFNNRTKGGGK